MLAGYGASAIARLGRLVRGSGWVWLGTAVMLTGAACFEPPASVIFSTVDGGPVLLEDVDPILADPDLTEAEKRQQLLDLGVPEDLIETLLRAS